MTELFNFLPNIDFFTLAIVLLACGGIFYYFYTRVNIIEESLINQGKILQTFLLNQQNLPNTLSHPDTTSNTNICLSKDIPSSTEKIEVSDDDDDDDDDDG